jgi:hypothetical protein
VRLRNLRMVLMDDGMLGYKVVRFTAEAKERWVNGGMSMQPNFAARTCLAIYSELDWQIISGHCHTVPVGSSNGEHRVVMDILNFKSMTAEESIAHARYLPPGIEPHESGWEKVFARYVQEGVPAFRELKTGTGVRKRCG